jgi:hypothetical protein
MSLILSQKIALDFWSYLNKNERPAHMLLILSQKMDCSARTKGEVMEIARSQPGNIIRLALQMSKMTLTSCLPFRRQMSGIA